MGLKAHQVQWIGLVVATIGYGGLWYFSNWKVALAVFVINWAINIEQVAKRMRGE